MARCEQISAFELAVGTQPCPVMPNTGRSTPLMLGALAHVVHDRQGADGQQHNCGEDNQYWPLHRDLDYSELRGLRATELSWFK